jgi:hypothetical protein
MKTHVVIFTIFCSSFFQVFSQDANLVRENVTMKLDSAHFSVSGEYVFSNPHSQPVSQTVFYPYQFVKEATKVDTISIYDMTDNQVLYAKRKMKNGVFFLLDLKSKEEKRVRVTYAQDHDGQSATYILSSARYLPGPLEQGTYSLKLSNKIEIDSFSIKPDNSGSIQDRAYYQWHKVNFKPSKDLIIWFHLKK